jgi:ferredoxin-NADP reductase
MLGSGFKETLRNAPLGYGLTVGVPAGRFIMPEGETRRHVFIAAGIGVTPYRSILRHAVDTKNPIMALMLYFNHSSADIVFRRELEEVAQEMPTFSLVHVLSEPEPGWREEQGKLNEALLRKYIPDLNQPFYWISGPPSVVEAYKVLLYNLGVTDKSVRVDSFIGY